MSFQIPPVGREERSFLAKNLAASQVTFDSLDVKDFPAAEYLIVATNGNDTHSVRVLLTSNGSDVWVSSSGKVITSADLFTLDYRESSSVIDMLLTPVNANTTVTARRRTPIGHDPFVTFGAL